MSAPWPESVERVAAVLRAASVNARVEAFATDTPTAEDAARAAGCSIAQIVKSIVLVCDGRPVVALVPGDRRVDRRKVAARAGAAKARIASAEEVLAATGFEAGAVAPFPLPGVSLVLVEQLMLGHDVLWVGAGSRSHLAAVGPHDLVTLSGARPADLVESDTYT